MKPLTSSLAALPMMPSTLAFPFVTLTFPMLVSRIPVSMIPVSIALIVLLLASMMLATPAFADTSATGANTLLKSLLSAIDQPLRLLLGVICYILGIIMVMRGLIRIPKHSAREGMHLTVSGTIMSLVVGGVLLTLPSQLDLFSQSLFGEASYTYASFGAKAGGSEASKAAKQIINTVLRFIQLFGLVWFISAWLNLTAASDGKSGRTYSGGIFRLVASTACWNIYALIDVVQGTLNLTILDIS